MARVCGPFAPETPLYRLAFLTLLAAAPVLADRFPAGMIEITDFGDAELAPVLEKATELVDKGDKTLLFRINSFGGSIFAGMDLILAIEDLKKRGVTVQCVVDFKAMSMGFVFLQSVCDERLMTKRSTLLTHNGSTSTRGTVEQIQEDAQLLAALNESMASTCADRLGMGLDEYKAKIAPGAWTMAWREALAVNAVDDIVDPADLPPLHRLAEAQLDLMQLLGL